MHIAQITRLRPASAPTRPNLRPPAPRSTPPPSSSALTFGLAAVLLLFTVGCASTRTVQSRVPSTSIQAEQGVASFYAEKYHGRKTASGERYNMHELTAAHRRLPFGAKVRVTNLNNNQSVIVRINDRGPFVRGRVIDLSLAAARKLDMVRSGVARVELAPVTSAPKPTVASLPR